MLQVVPGDQTFPDTIITPTAREKVILQHIAKGLTAKEIGQSLDISPRTVQKHVVYLCMKMRARNKTHLAAMAVSFGWVAPDDIISGIGAGS